jgi:hypothetical protein
VIVDSFTQINITVRKVKDLLGEMAALKEVVSDLIQESHLLSKA